MTSKRPMLGVAAILAVGGLLGLSAVYAQNDNGQSAGSQRTRKTPAVSETLYRPLAKAQNCAQKKDFKCAMKYLSQIRDMKHKNSYETALMWQTYAYVYLTQNKAKDAIAAYENLLQLPDLPLGLEQQISLALSKLYLQEQAYQKALTELDHWFSISEKPGPKAYLFKAQIYYEMKDYKKGLAPLQTALRLAKAQHLPADESWYQLLNFFYYELKDYGNAVKTTTYLINHWPKKQYLMTLAGLYGEQGNEQYQLALFQAANAMGWLTGGTEKVQLAEMLLSAGIPYKAARILEKGLEDGTITSNETDWRTLAQSWQLADNDRKAIPALKHAASLSKDGQLDYQLANSYANLAEWRKCVDASHMALNRGMKTKSDAQLLLGDCLAQLKEYDKARAVFKSAETDEHARRSAQRYLAYVKAEEDREAKLKRAAQRAH